MSGFLLTGSAGGSLNHSAAQNVVALELVDGVGRVHKVHRDDPDPKKRDLFEAAGVSMGLLGVVTRVWLQTKRAFDVVGREVTHPLASSPVDPFDGGRDGLAGLFQRHDFSRVLWWPQQGFDRIQIWTGDRQAPRGQTTPFEILGRWDTLLGSLLQTLVGNVNDLSAVPERLEDLEWFRHLERTLVGVPKHELLHRPKAATTEQWGTSTRNAQRIAAVTHTVMQTLLRQRALAGAGRRLGRRMPEWVGPLTSLFVPDGEKSFSDRWHLGLPMDNQLDDQLWPTEFAELWIPLEHAAEAMCAVREVVAADGDAKERHRRVGAFPIEMYPGPASDFWLSPGYQRPALRVNPARFIQWKGEPHRHVLQLFMDALRPFDPRPHWGKHLPHADDAWRSQLKRGLPRLDDFLRLRAELDPKGVFLTDYWRQALAIDAG